MPGDPEESVTRSVRAGIGRLGPPQGMSVSRSFRCHVIAGMLPLVAGCSAGHGGYDNERAVQAAPVPAEDRFDGTIVYGVNPSVPLDRLREDCVRRGGTLNTCGSPCAPAAGVCAQVCAVTCEGVTEGADDRPGPEMVDVVLLDPEHAGDTARHGCDVLAIRQRRAAPGDNPAESALRALFAIDQVRVDGLYNFIGRTRDTLHLEGVDVKNGTAHVRLSGYVSGLGGVCDDPRARIQIEQTALRAPGVARLIIFLNGRQSNLQPDAQGVYSTR